MIIKTNTSNGVSRRGFLAGASLAALALYQRRMFAAQAHAALSNQALVRTPLGVVRGETVGDR